MNPLLILFLGVFLIVVCESPGQYIVAHRGASHDAPENTMAAFHLAWERGADAIEGDFYLSKDGEIVCIHDKDLKRVAGKKVNVADLTLEALRQFDVGSWKDKRFANERIPTLAEVLATVTEGKRIFIEIKCGAEIVPALETEINASGLKHEQMVIISFDEAVITGCRQVLPKLKASWLTGYEQDKITQKWTPSHKDVLAALKRTKATGLGTKAERAMVNEDLVNQLRAEKLEFHTWTIDDPDLAKHFRLLGVDSITTNRPGWLRAQLAE